MSKQYMKRVSLLTKTAPMPQYHLTLPDEEAAASNSLPSSSSEPDFIGRKKPKPTKKPGSASGTFLYFYQLGKATRSFSCTQEHYGLDCSFTEEQLILGGRWTLHVIPENVLTLEENEAAPKQLRKLDSIFQHHKQQTLLLREIKARHLLFKKKDKKSRMCFHSTSQISI